jgi:hypothetical protein
VGFVLSSVIEFSNADSVATAFDTIDQSTSELVIGHDEILVDEKLLELRWRF